MENASASTTPQHIENRGEQEPLTFDPRATFDLDALEALRQSQHEAYDHAFKVNTEEGFSKETADFYAKNTTSAVIDQYLESNGLTRDDERYNAYHNALSKVSINDVKDEDWVATFKEGTTEQGQSGRDKARALYTGLTGKGYYDSEVGDDEEGVEATERITTPENIDPAVEAARAELSRRREALAALNAKRQGRLFGQGGEKYKEALRAYTEQLRAVGRLELDSTLNNESIDQDEKNLQVITYLYNEQAELRKASIDALKETKVSKVIEWMNKGNVAVRIAKGVALGAGAAVVGAGIGAVAGVAGAAALGAGIAATATGAVRFARGFARSDAKKGRGMQQLDAATGLEEAKQLTAEEGEDYFEAIQTHFNDKFEADTDKEQRKRLRSIGAGVLGIALGAGIGTAAHFVADSGAFDGWLNRGPSLPFTDETVSAEGQPDDTLLSKEVHAPFEHTPEPVETEVPEATGNWGPEALPDPQFGIQSGEGGIHFFQRIGLTEGNWYEASNELLEKFPNEFYSDNGDVRIVNSGQLSTEAQQFIKQRFGLA